MPMPPTLTTGTAALLMGGTSMLRNALAGIAPMTEIVAKTKINAHVFTVLSFAALAGSTCDIV
jgi:hypothetical protein